jgi:cytochrome c oxidase subunit 1
VSAATEYLPVRDVRTLRWQIYLSLIAFAIGIFAGLAQALDRVLPASSSLWHFFPLQQNYYQGLTMHGVLEALVFTFAFSNGFLPLVVAKSLGTGLPRRVVDACLGVMVLGVVLAGSQIVLNKASVLFTMYPPLQATPAYYLGAALLVVSTWLAALAVTISYRAWRKEHPSERVPLPAFTVLATYAMWFLASLGVAVEVLVLLLPWSLGVFPKIDAELARSLFWFSGHPIVYFWLLPAYISWYTMVPRQAGGRLFSDPLTRLVFVLFLLVSIPTGFHHQFTDPGISETFKKVHLLMTFAVFFPSLITAFTIMASLEEAGRWNGGKGLFGWIRRLPWSDPSVTAQLLAMLAFVLGGISGLVNASYSVNLVVHNSSWVPGHFHLTVGTAVALSFMGISYWLIPHLTGRALVWRRAAVVQSWIWFVGVLIFSRGQIMGGLEGLPRRENVSQMTYGLPEWKLSHMMTGLGGTLMFIGGLTFLVVIAATLWRGSRGAEVDMPLAEVRDGAETGSPLLDKWPLWIGLAVLLIVLAYGPYFVTYTPNFVAKGWKLWGGG